MNNYKVCILAAGIGSRMPTSKKINKSLLPLNDKTVISYIIEKFPEDIEFVIAVGYKKDFLIEYLTTSYPNRKIIFVDIDPFQGEGSGPGYSLYCCRFHLNCPFILTAADTLIREDVSGVDSNWLGVAEVPDTSRFCSVKIEGSEKIVRIDNKVKTDNKYAFIGIAGIKDYELFWDALKNNKEIIAGEIQTSNGIIALLNKDLKSKKFTWFDTGTPSSYEHAKKNYPHGQGYQGE